MIPVAEPSISDKEKKYVLEALESGWVSSTGPFVERLEKAWGEYLGEPNIINTNNGTAALHMALLGLGIGPGDEVIIPASSFIATLNAVLYVGATPVFVDIEKETWGIDVGQAESAITSKTKAIIGVHLYGFACDIAALKKLAEKKGIFLVEDNAEAFGATVNGKKLGTIGDVGTYSFFGNKIMTTGEGGAVSTPHKDVLERMKLYKNQGRKTNKTYFHEVLGYNYRLTNLQAALGLAQLEQIEGFIANRAQIEAIYDAGLKGLVERQKDVDGAKHVNWLYTCVFRKKVDIEKLAIFLEQNGVETRRVFYPMNTMQYLPESVRSKEFPIARTIYENGITLPTYVGLSNADVENICDLIKVFVTHYAG